MGARDLLMRRETDAKVAKSSARNGPGVCFEFFNLLDPPFSVSSKTNQHRTLFKPPPFCAPRYDPYVVYCYRDMGARDLLWLT